MREIFFEGEMRPLGLDCTGGDGDVPGRRMPSEGTLHFDGGGSS